MTARGSWKSTERRICRELGGDRSTSPLQNTKHGTDSDCVDCPEYVEVKMRQEDKTWAALRELHDSTPCQTYDRSPLILYQAEDGPTWTALWLEDYIEHARNRYTQNGLGPEPINLAHAVREDRWYFRHEVGKRLTNRTLVTDTMQKAKEEGKPPLCVIQRKGSSLRVALVPLEAEP